MKVIERTLLHVIVAPQFKIFWKEFQPYTVSNISTKLQYLPESSTLPIMVVILLSSEYACSIFPPFHFQKTIYNAVQAAK